MAGILSKLGDWNDEIFGLIITGLVTVIDLKALFWGLLLTNIICRRGVDPFILIVANLRLERRDTFGFYLNLLNTLTNMRDEVRKKNWSFQVAKKCDKYERLSSKKDSYWVQRREWQIWEIKKLFFNGFFWITQHFDLDKRFSDKISEQGQRPMITILVSCLKLCGFRSTPSKTHNSRF